MYVCLCGGVTDNEIKEQYEINEGVEKNIDSNTDEQQTETKTLE